MKKLFRLAIVLTLVLTLFGCNKERKIDGKTGETFSTMFFDFVVESAEIVDSYAGYTPEEGNVLLDVVVYSKNTFGEAIPMYISDYILYTENYYWIALEALDETMAPETMELADGASMTYHYVFEILADEAIESIVHFEEYIDTDGNEQEGDTFTVTLNVE